MVERNNLIRRGVIFFALFSFITVSVPAMSYEEPNFTIIKKSHVYEVRRYERRTVAEVTYGDEDSGFRVLFDYISGANKDIQEIQMTVPVTQTKKDDQMFMQFYLPSKFNRETTPMPNNPDLEITTIPEGYFAVINFSGRSSDKNFDKHNKILKQKLLEDNISIKGFAIRATYNSPFTLPLLRRNEAMFNVDWKN